MRATCSGSSTQRQPVSAPLRAMAPRAMARNASAWSQSDDMMTTPIRDPADE